MNKNFDDFREQEQNANKARTKNYACSFIPVYVSNNLSTTNENKVFRLEYMYCICSELHQNGRFKK